METIALVKVSETNIKKGDILKVVDVRIGYVNFADVEIIRPCTVSNHFFVDGKCAHCGKEA